MSLDVASMLRSVFDKPLAEIVGRSTSCRMHGSRKACSDYRLIELYTAERALRRFLVEDRRSLIRG